MAKKTPARQKALEPWWEVAVGVPAILSDDAAALLVDVGALGVEMVSDELPPPRFDQGPPSEAPTRPAPGEVGLIVSYDGDLSEADVLSQMREALGEIGIVGSAMHARRRNDTDWAERWKSYFKPMQIGRLWVVPSWEQLELPANALRIELDPGLAFGTGQHATTALCLETMEAGLAGRPLARLIDVGCGSGILAIAAVRLGVREVVAINNDPIAVDVTRENAEKNGVSLQASAAPLDEIEGRFDWVVANIMAGTLIELAQALWTRVAPAGALVLSGILSDQEADVARAFVAVSNGHLELEDARRRDGWVALRYRRRALDCPSDLSAM